MNPLLLDTYAADWRAERLRQADHAALVRTARAAARTQAAAAHARRAHRAAVAVPADLVVAAAAHSGALAAPVPRPWLLQYLTAPAARALRSLAERLDPTLGMVTSTRTDCAPMAPYARR